MGTPDALYARFYARRKNTLFPIIEKYYGVSLKGKSHGQVIQIYYRLLRTNEAFRIEIDKLVAGQNYKNADAASPIGGGAAGGAFAAFTNLFAGGSAATTLSGTVPKTDSGVDTGGGIGGFFASIFGYASTVKAAKAQTDAQFMEIVLAEQKQNDTTKILIVSGVALLFVGVGAYFVLKMKK